MGYPADWRITSRCTLACDFCYGPVPANDPKAARKEIFRALVDSSAEVITFCGGEPLLVDEIGDYAAGFQAARKRTILNTNGTLLRRRLDEGMQMSFDVVGLSLDGSTADVHCQMRGDRAGFKAVLDAMKIVSHHPDTKLKVATVISRVNQHDISNLTELICELKPDIWRLYQYSEIGPYNRGQSRHRIPDSSFARVAELARAAVAPIKVFASPADLQASGCLIVSMDGTVFQATPVTDLVYGNCLDAPLDQIWHSVSKSAVISENKKWHDLLIQHTGNVGD